MEENKQSVIPDAAPTPSAADPENRTGEAANVTIPIKFNKETKNLTADEAATLAQKGLKFELIEKDFCKLKDLAGRQKMSVPEYISELEKNQSVLRKNEILNEYKENDALAERIVELEKGKEEDDGLEELREYFPSVKSLSDLPRAVVESARLKGENLLNSYLKYRIVKKRQADDERYFERSAKNASIGSLKSGGDTAGDDFIKALWGK